MPLGSAMQLIHCIKGLRFLTACLCFMRLVLTPATHFVRATDTLVSSLAGELDPNVLKNIGPQLFALKVPRVHVSLGFDSLAVPLHRACAIQALLCSCSNW